jgi:hypothetical protein
MVLATVLIIGLVGCEGAADSDPGATTSSAENVDSTNPSSSTTSTTSPTSVTTSVVTTSTLSVLLPAKGPTFGEETGVLLLLDDGIDGLTAVDPDRRLIGRSVVEGQRAGDEQYSMVRVGDKLVVGWGEPHSVDIATRQGVSLGHATIFVPAAEPGRVWMIDSGARIGSEPVYVWQVDVVTGEAIHDPVPLEADRAQIGITGGLALQTESGLDLWTLEGGQVVPLESTGPGFVHDVFDNRLVWCSGDCTTLTMTNTETLETQQYPPPNGYATFAYESRFSSDGRYLAALVWAPEATGIWILDRETGLTRVVSDLETHVDYLAWAPDGDQLFATSYSYSQPPHTVAWRYQISDQEFTTVVLPFGGSLSLVVVDDSFVDAYIAGEPEEPGQCQASSVYPSDRSEMCIFGY